MFCKNTIKSQNIKMKGLFFRLKHTFSCKKQEFMAFHFTLSIIFITFATF